MNNYEEILDHYKKNWNLVSSYFMTLEFGPMKELNPEFKVLVIPSNEKREMWTYATIGMSSSDTLSGIELHMFSENENDDIVELLTITAYYHLAEKAIRLDDTVNFGKSWISRSNCDHGLISLPYLDGPSLEKLTLKNRTIFCYWLIPITKKERDYKWEFGIEKLEEKLEEKGFNYLDPFRPSVV